MNYSYPPWYIDFITGHTCGNITSKTEMQYHFKCINKLDLLAVFYRFVSLIDDDVRGMWLILGMYQIQGIDFCTVEWKTRRSIITWQKKYITHTRTVIFMTQARDYLIFRILFLVTFRTLFSNRAWLWEHRVENRNSFITAHIDEFVQKRRNSSNSCTNPSIYQWGEIE